MAHGCVDGADRQRRIRAVWETHRQPNPSSLAHTLSDEYRNGIADDHPAPDPDRDLDPRRDVDALPNLHCDRDLVAESYAQCNSLSH